MSCYSPFYLLMHLVGQVSDWLCLHYTTYKHWRHTGIPSFDLYLSSPKLGILTLKRVYVIYLEAKFPKQPPLTPCLIPVALVQPRETIVEV